MEGQVKHPSIVACTRGQENQPVKLKEAGWHWQWKQANVPSDLVHAGPGWRPCAATP